MNLLLLVGAAFRRGFVADSRRVFERSFMEASKIDQAHATAVSLRGELHALPERRKAMTDDELDEKLRTLAGIVGNHVDLIKEIQQQIANDNEYS